MIRTIRAWWNRVFLRKELGALIERAEFSYEAGKGYTAAIFLKHEMIAEFTHQWVAYLDEVGGKNNVSMQIVDRATMRQFELSLQLVGGLTTIQLNSILKHTVEAIYNDDSNAKAVAESTLRKLGYIK